ncbi:hypothetical protein DOJK_01206 [Patescibacteria group bacterium]|nr:hypothetical protein DOJK_01206 [Patescibacteria group bacterium]
MSTLTFRLPDDKHERLRQLAKQRDVSVNRLLDELVTQTLAEYDVYNRFQIRSARGSAKEGLAILDKLDNL